VPERLTRAEHSLDGPPDPVPQHDDGGRRGPAWHDPADEEQEPLHALGLVWHTGWSTERSVERWRGSRRAVVSAHDADGTELRRWDLGVGTVRATAVSGGLVVVAVERARTPPWARAAPVELVALDPAHEGHEVLLAPDAVDVTEHCWPLVPEPLEAGSYAERVRAANDGLDTWWSSGDATGPLANGLSAGSTRLVADWPDTHLQWTFDHDSRPGAVLRRRVPLFDELGRITPPEHADIHLMEDLETGDLPPITATRDGILDV
jgi:hypothetical protein